MIDDTIAAIGTPIGEGGLAIVRISGAHALEVAEKAFVPGGENQSSLTKASSHTIHYGHIVRNGAVVDEVLVGVMRAPRTFTRENVVEITCHGGILAAKTILDTLLESGARLALSAWAATSFELSLAVLSWLAAGLSVLGLLMWSQPTPKS